MKVLPIVIYGDVTNGGLQPQVAVLASISHVSGYVVAIGLDL